MTTVEQAAEVAAVGTSYYGSDHYVSFVDGYLAGHASRDEEVAAKEEEIARLREALSGCANAIGNGAFASPACSVEFLSQIPAEIKAEIATLRDKLDSMREPLWMLREEHEAEIAALRAKLAEAEGRAAKWVRTSDEAQRLLLIHGGWRVAIEVAQPETSTLWKLYVPPSLTRPPVPLPETKP